MTVFVVGRILLHGDYCILTKDSMLNDFYHVYSVRRILLSADKTLFHSFYCPSQKGGIYVDETLLIEFIAYWQKTVFIAQQFLLLHRLRPRNVCWRNDSWSWGKRGSSPTLDWPGKPPWWEMISSCCCCWSLLHSTMLHPQADLLRLHVIRHEWLVSYSALSPAPCGGVLLTQKLGIPVI